MTITTAYLLPEIICLLPLNIDHANILHLLRTDPEVSLYLDRKIPESLYETLSFILSIEQSEKQKECVYRGIFSHDRTDLMGTICLWNIDLTKLEAEIGFEMFPKFQGKGIMLEACNRLIEFGFKSMNLNNIIAYTYPDNIASIRLLDKLSFIKCPEKVSLKEKYLKFELFKIDYERNL